MLDIALAVAVLLGGGVDILTDPQRQGTVAVAASAVAAMSAATIWRRRTPLLFVAAVMVLVLVLRTTVPNITDLNFLPIFVLLAPAYTVAAHDTKVRSALGLAICLTTFVVLSVVGSGRGTWYFAAGMGSAAWAIGRAVRAQRILAAELVQRSERLVNETVEREALAVAQERTRIANELNRDVADTLSSLIVQSRSAQRLLELDWGAADQAMEGIESTARLALAEVRQILGTLRRMEDDHLLSPLPGIRQLPALIARRAGQPDQVHLEISGEAGPVAASVDMAVFRLVEESLTHVSRSNGPVEVAVRYTAEFVELDIAAPVTPSEDWPTAAMRERVALCQGTLTRETGKICVRLPRTLEGSLT